jgi:Spy/CpxP family protein refolding chaperone
MKLTDVISRCAALVAVIVVLCLSGPASAQGFKWWQADSFIKELGLTAEQTRRCEEIFQKALPRLKANKTALDAAEQKFQRLIDRGDEAAMEQINVVEAARAELNKARALMLWNMRKVLTNDQWAKFTALHLATERERDRDRSHNNDRRQ